MNIKMLAIALVLGVFGPAACTQLATDVNRGQQDYGDLCAGCHGETGQGNGTMAPVLPKPPADLTRIAARNGGVFPRVAVMSKIDGYARDGRHFGMMPSFGGLLDGRTVLVDTGDGVLTPTPERLAALTAYLEQLQR